MTFFNRTGRAAQVRAARDVSAAAIERSAPTRNKALCAGVDPFVARMTGGIPTPPQPHRWWPVGRRGAVCLRCSEYRRDG